MSFQGDVRGIGLAELLQGLARGRKEGVLTLSAKEGSRCVLGVEGGSIYLLPEPEEDPEIWRERMRNALADDPQFQITPQGLSAIAKGARLDKLYDLLDGEGLHFRFEPVPIPGRGEFQEAEPGVYCEGIQIDYLLLEYARIKDELEGAGDLNFLHGDGVPRVLDPQVPPDPANRTVYANIDGNSTVAETADRLGWTQRQTKLGLLGELRAGRVYLAHPNDVLHLALHELSRSNISRAAARIQSWTMDGDPGPLPHELADALDAEWLAGRLNTALDRLSPRSVRILLRRLDRAMRDPVAAAGHWQEAERVHPWDSIARLHRIACEFRDESDETRPELRELLDMARAFREADHPWRSGPVLVMAAHLQPQTPLLMIELGQGLLTAGRISEGAPWILSGSAGLLEKDEADRAIVPLRALYTADPHNRECRQLLARAKRSTTQVRRLRKHLFIGLAATGVLAGVATVQVRRDQDRNDRIQEVQALSATPKLALAKLDQLFPGDTSPEVAKIRADLGEQERVEESTQRNDWLKAYDDASKECNAGDPVLGLTMALAMPEHPRLRLIQEPWPLRQDLLEGIVTNFQGRIGALGEPDFENVQQKASEDEMLRQLEQLRNVLLEREQPNVAEAELSVELDLISDDLAKREIDRNNQREKRAVEEREAHQDLLWQRAQGFANSGRFSQADSVYQELLETDESGKIALVLEEEIQGNTTRLQAVRDAQALSDEGKHEEALALLKQVLEIDNFDPYAYVMPWDVKSFPSGAQVVVDDLDIETTPFTLQTTFGEATRLVASLEGFESREVNAGKPSDQYIYLSRLPERAWKGEGRVDALPVQMEDGTAIFVDRGGHAARVAAGGRVIWEAQVQTLSGIARSPVFLPELPGHLLMVTQDGKAWMIRAEDGDLQGPWDLGSPPVAGPYQTQQVVRVRLQNGKVTYWKDRLRPYAPNSQSGTSLVDRDEDYRFGSSAGLHVLRRRRDLAKHLDSIWNPWTVEVQDEVYRVRHPERPEDDYTVLRDGEWEYLAWEAPRPNLPEGRLWISDGAGLRAFVPLSD